MPYRIEPFTFRFETSRIEVDAGVADVDCGYLYDTIKLAQSSEEGIIYDRVASGSGLQALGPGVQTGLTVELLGPWQLQFAAGNYVARIAGGNLIGGPGGDPVAYSAGVQTLLIQSASSTVVTAGGSVPTAAQVAAAVCEEVCCDGGGGGCLAALLASRARRRCSATVCVCVCVCVCEVRVWDGDGMVGSGHIHTSIHSHTLTLTRID